MKNGCCSAGLKNTLIQLFLKIKFQAAAEIFTIMIKDEQSVKH